MRKAIGILSFFLLLTPLTLLAEDAAAPQQTIQSFIETIQTMEFPVKDAASHQVLVAKANAALDLDSMGQKSLAAHWAEASPEEQKNFLELLWKLIENSAYPKSRRFMGSFKIEYPEVTPEGNGVSVRSVIKQQEEALDAEVIYHVYQKDGQWKVDDVTLDGVSIIEDLKYQFDKIITQSGFAGLLDKMRERLAAAVKENNPAAS